MESFSGCDVVTAEVVDLSVGGDAQGGGRAGQHRTGVNVATPAAIASIEEFGQLTERAVGEAELEIKRGIAQVGSALKASFQFEGAGVADVDVRADGAGLQPESPQALRFEPESEVGIGEGEGLLHLAKLEI